MKSSLCLIRKKRTASFRIVGSMLAITSLGLMLAMANRSAQAQTSAGVSSAATSAVSSPGDWTQFHFDNMQRWNPFETVLGVNNVGNLGLKWTFPVGTSTQPVVVNGVAYVGTVDGAVEAMNANTGAVLWNDEIGGTIATSPAVVNGVVYIGSFDHNVYALNAATGAKLWTFTTGDEVNSSPAVANGVVYIGSDDKNVYALNAGTGAKLWSFTTGSREVVSSPAVVNGVVYVGSVDDNVYALNASTGVKLWSFATGNQVGSSPAVANGVVYIGSQDDNVYALNASTGAKLWSFATSGTVQSSPAVANGVVYIGSKDDNVYALNASTGVKLWSFAPESPEEFSPAVANGVVYIAGNNPAGTSNVYALNASTGALLWNFASGGPVFSSPVVVNGMVYVSPFAFALGGAGAADLFLRVQPSTTTVHQGDLLTYAFPVWNLGPANAVHEVLNTQVPAGTTFDYIRISGTPGLGTCTTPKYLGTGQIICHENASMAPNTTWTVRLTVRVTAPSGTVITENAATLADTPDSNSANNTATVSMKVE
jgi:uncharacterized repeat protein (TIGR01451 family)